MLNKKMLMMLCFVCFSITILNLDTLDNVYVGVYEDGIRVDFQIFQPETYEYNLEVDLKPNQVAYYFYNLGFGRLTDE